MSRTEKLEQAVLGEGSIVRPEMADTSERHHKQTCFKLSARPTPANDIVHKTDVNTNINTDRSENSAPRNILDVNLDIRLREGMSHTQIFEQSVLGEGSIVRPEAADIKAPSRTDMF